MLNIFYDRIINEQRIPNGIREDWLPFYTPQFNAQLFRKNTRFDPAVYTSDIGKSQNFNTCLVDNIEKEFKDVKGCLGIYPIEGYGSPDRSVGLDNRWNKKFKTAFDYMSNKAKKYIKSGKLRLYYGFLQEAFIKNTEIVNLHNEMKKYGVKSAIVVVNDYLAADRYSKWCEFMGEDKLFNIIVFSHSLFEKSQEVYCILNGIHNGLFTLGENYKEHKNSAISIEQFKSTKDVKRKSNLLCLNRRMRPHRIATLCVMNKHNLIENNEVSFQFTIDKDTPYYVERIFDENKQKYYEDDFHKIKDMKYRYVDYPITMDGKDGINHGYGFENAKPYLDTYFSVVTETEFANPTGYVSEKLWKPISFFQPFILVGSPGSLKFIKEFGFKTFDGFIDESYDDMKHHKKRFEVIEKEIIRLGKMSKDEIHDWYWSMEDILVYNFNLFIEYAKHNQSAFDELMDTLTDHSITGTFIPSFRRDK